MLLFGSPADLLNGKLELRSLFGQKDVEQNNCRLQDRLTIALALVELLMTRDKGKSSMNNYNINNNNNNNIKTSNNNNGEHREKGKSSNNGFLMLSLPGNIPGLGLLRKFQQYRRLPQEAAPPPAVHHLEEELDRLTGKIDNLLCRIEGQDQELAKGGEDECLVCGTNKASMLTLPCDHQVVCRQCFVRTIQMAVVQKRLPLRCILCRAKVLRIKQDQRGGRSGVSEEPPLPKSVSGYNLGGSYISSSGSSYSFTSGVSAVSSESCCSRKSSIARDFSFSSLSNFQNVNLLNKSQIPRSKSGSFSNRRSRRSRSPSPLGSSRSRSVEVPPMIRVSPSPPDELISPSPSSPLSPGLPPPRSPTLTTSPWTPRSPRSPTSPTSPQLSPGDQGERLFSSRGSSRLSTPLSPIKESRKEHGSLQELPCSPVKEREEVAKRVGGSQRHRPSSRIRCTEQILSQLEVQAMQPAIKKLSSEDIASFERSRGGSGVRGSKSVTFKDC